MTEQNIGSAGDSVISGNNHPDLEAVEPPSKPPTEYDHVERRAELLQLVREVGHPSLLHQGQMAERFGVSQPMISKDLDRIAEYVSENLGARHDLGIEAVFKRSIRGLLEDEEYRKAARTAKEYDEWVTERTDLEELREELEFLKKAHDIDT
jgi:hypothetical protein